MSLRKTLPAGVIDAGFNSLATFAVGLTATRILEPALLGVYAVFYTAHLVGIAVPWYLIYTPAEIRAIEREMDQRLPILRQSIFLATGPSLLTGLAILMALVVVRSQASTSQLLGLAWTAAVATVLIPAQAHVRRMLHIAGSSWLAATTSATQLVASTAAIFALLAADVPNVLVPFGALAIATLISILIGLVLAAPWRRRSHQRLNMTDLVTTGRWLLVTGVLPAVAGFVAASLISHLASPEDLGFAEAARLAAQPLFVLVTGLNAVLGPRSMEAAHRHDRVTARYLERVYIVIVLAAAAGYVAVAGVGFAMPPQRELLGGHLEKKLAKIEVLSSAFLVLTAATAFATKSYARPASVAAQNLWRNIHYRRDLQPLYREPPKTFFGHFDIIPSVIGAEGIPGGHPSPGQPGN
jgi:O-antigen/teichoic acid export membrane protein